ncbi:MAG: 1-acyl-sn-glycerol-3-phosphate acyltransferase [Clostridia bacterium]|nr:1-acyl-sn-glycerol-3-phosphate acyltransferase [Clostridia bacterium]
MKTFFRVFAKITAFPAQLLFFKRKTYYENENAAARVKGGAIIISNHTHLIFDYVVNMFMFFFRKLSCLFAEVLYTHGAILRFLLSCLGGIKVDRNSKDLSFMDKAVKILEKGGLLQIFPEGKLETEKKLLPFKTSYILIALRSGKPIIPIVTDGVYHLFKRTRVIVGERIYLSDYYKGDNPSAEDIEALNKLVFDKVKKLRRKIERNRSIEKNKLTALDKLSWDFGRIVTFTFNLGLRIRVRCADKKRSSLKLKGAFIIASNHTDLFDPVTLICVFWRRRIRALTAIDVFEGKILREYFMTKLGCIGLNREIDDIDAFKRCIDTLESGIPLMIFPEGHIVKGGIGTEKLKSGAALMAAMTGVPVVPVFIKKRKSRFKMTHVYVGEPFTVGSGGKMPEIGELSEYDSKILGAIEALEREAIR